MAISYHDWTGSFASHFLCQTICSVFCSLFLIVLWNVNIIKSFIKKLFCLILSFAVLLTNKKGKHISYIFNVAFCLVTLYLSHFTSDFFLLSHFMEARKIVSQAKFLNPMKRNLLSPLKGNGMV